MKTLAGTLGFMMLFFVPSEEAMTASIWKALGGWVLCLCVAIALLSYAGAFKQRASTNKRCSRRPVIPRRAIKVSSFRFEGLRPRTLRKLG